MRRHLEEDGHWGNKICVQNTQAQNNGPGGPWDSSPSSLRRPRCSGLAYAIWGLLWLG
jgi:hypothetical protein